MVVCVLSFAAWRGLTGEQMWFGSVSVGGHVLHPLVLIFGLSGSLMISRIHIRKL